MIAVCQQLRWPNPPASPDPLPVELAITSPAAGAVFPFPGTVSGTIAGAGTVIVLDDTSDLRQVLARIGSFFAHESCGKCYPCQMGTQRQAELLARVARGEARPTDAADLVELAGVMADTSICGLGQAAPMAALNAYQHWPELFSP